MTSYAPVAVTGSAIPGQPAGDNFNGNGGVRREWWWRAGPVDSCCCCCSLRTGVALLALDSLITGCWLLFIMRTFYITFLGSSIETLQSQYVRACEGAAASTPDCLQLKKAIDQGVGAIDLYRHLPGMVNVQGAFCLVAGVVGLWAVFLRSRRAAKIFMLTWPAKFVLAVVGTIQFQRLYNEYGVETRFQGIIWLITIFFLLYYFKVSWSYYMKRVEYDNCVTHSSSGSRTVSPDRAYRGTPMPAMSTHV
eukprot:jgi/Undpi1/1837/HiC_scaffold_12.g05224.m1